MQQSANDDSVDGYGPDIDAALVRMEHDDISEITTSPGIAAFLILARYYALTRFASLLSTRVDTDALAVEGDRESVFNNVMELLEYTAKEAAAYGYVVWVASLSQVGTATNASAWGRGVLDTGYLPHIEPLVADEDIL